MSDDSPNRLRDALTKLVTALVLIVPPIGYWIDAKGKAQVALTAASTESATSDMTYETLVERINDLEADTTARISGLELKVAMAERDASLARELATARHPRLRTKASTAALALELLARERTREPIPLSTERPTPPPAAVQAAEAAFEREAK